MVDQTDTYTNRILIDAAEALDSLTQLRQQINNYKQSISTIAQQSNESFAAVAEAIKRATSEAKKAALEQLAKTGPPQGLTISEAQAQIAKEYAINTKAITAAIRELNAEQKTAAESAKRFGGDGEAAARAYREQINQLKTSIQQIAQTQKVSFKDAAQGLVQAGQPTKAVNQALRELNTTADSTGKSFLSMGNIMKFVFGTILGITAIGILRDFIGWLQKAAQAGLEFVKAVYQMEIGVRALQRAGVDITIREVYENIDRLRERFKVFTTKELVVGSAAFVNLIRDLGYTKEEIFQLQDAIATLAVVNGRAMDEVQRTVALALSSGYTEGLQRLGVSINRVTIAEKAAQLGWEGGYTALTEQQRAYATYQLVLEKTALYQDDLVTYYQTLPGQIEATNAAIKEQTNVIGTLLVPLDLLIAKVKLFGVTWFKNFSGITMAARALGIMFRAIEYARDLFDEFVEVSLDPSKLTGITKAFYDLAKNIEAVFSIPGRLAEGINNKLDQLAQRSETWAKFLELARDYLSDISNIIQGIPLQTLGDTEVGGKTDAENTQAFVDEMIGEIDAEEKKFQKDSVKAWDNYQDDLAKINRDGLKRLADLWKDYMRELQDIDIDVQRDLAEAARDYQNKLADIDRDVVRDTDKEYRDYYRDLADIDRKAVQNKEKAEREYRDREINEEEKFQERMRKLREDFLFDLEDAVRERDARQIIRLIRQYNKEREQAERDHQLDKKQRAGELAEKLADIERQRQIEKQERAIDLQQRLQDIQIAAAAERQEAAIANQQKIEDIRRQAEEKRADALADYEQDKADEKLRQEEKRADAKEAYKQELLDLKEAQAERLIEVAEGLAQEYNVNADMLAQMQTLFESYYGPEGVYTKIIQAFYASLAGFMGGVSAPDPSKFGGGAKSTTNTKSKSVPGFATGGSFIARGATAAVFGEGGEELVTAIPLARPGNAGKTYTSVQGSPSGMDGRVEVLLYLSPDLESRIINNTMNATANVILNVQKAKVQRGI